MKSKPWWIKERDNPQLGTYYVAMGPMTVKEAEKYENSLYGFNIMHKFETKEAYEQEIYRLKQSGARVQ